MLKPFLAAFVVAVLAWPAQAQSPGEALDSALDAFLQAVTDDIQANTDAAAANAAAITALQDARDALQMRVDELQAALDLNSQSIAGNAGGITTNGEGIATNATSIAGLQSQLNDVLAALASVEDRLTALESNDPPPPPPPPPPPAETEIVDTDEATPDEVFTNAAHNSYAGYTASVANMPEGVTLTEWDLPNWAGGRFRLDTDTGRILARRVDGDDYSPGAYEIRIRATLSDGTVLEKTVTMTIVEQAAEVPEVPPDAIVVQQSDSIEAAFANAGEGDFIHITGVHRITAPLFPKDDQKIFLDNAVIDGSVLLDPNGWTASGSVWRQAIPDAQGTSNCECSQPDQYTNEGNRVAAEREKLIVDGRIIREAEPGQAMSGMQWRHEDGQAVLNFDPAGHVIEVTHAERVLKGPANNVHVFGRSPETAVIRGAATPLAGGMIQITGLQGSILERVTVEDSSSGGIETTCDIVIESVVRQNGQIGIAGNNCSNGWPRAKNGLYYDYVIDSEIYENNISGYREEWLAGAGKFGHGLSFCRVAGNRVWGNFGTALWVDNRGGGGCVFEDNKVWDNARSGAHAEFQAVFEGHECSLLVRNNIFVNNSPQSSFEVNRATFQARRNPGACFENNIVVMSGDGNWLGIKQNEAEIGTEWVSRNTRVRNNVVAFLPGTSGVGGIRLAVPGSIVDLNSDIDGNTYVIPDDEQDVRRWFLKTTAGGGQTSWTSWQSAGFDANGQRLFVPDVVAWLATNHPEAAALLN